MAGAGAVAGAWAAGAAAAAAVAEPPELASELPRTNWIHYSH